MSNSRTQNLDLFDPFESQPKSIFNKLGNKLGGIAVSTKKFATKKYLEMTQGINQRIAEEDEQLQAEIFSHLEAQAEEFEQELSQRQKRWFWISFILTLVSFCIGAVGAFFLLTK
ncbi:hypothetical protein HT665_04075 [Ursidibacter maritimus]|uniref:Uncharacterized protein n=1 Tax=Ursidibacter maritimus TaxID=1331689 RepID=A0A949T3F1_9PAST|nr:hypothetical protein [Ursidibacter maritimus]KAE9541368.1 hypothetical protein A1D26_00195 [Ursidibacter maritimus]MBV6524770.1 hypothetical protein [Ursidibacter maritimus]MBV6526484.1 hypothetical protein [Ursidibacter maritimus]MBV6527112.1 hypothetical protein [Ursidibacter maritimus]MBV6529053.1 hypothetical protein [Ursidibacter maritimus]